MASLLLLNGPNLNMLGAREPEVYGDTTLESIESHLKLLAGELGHELTVFQSNAEHEIVGCVHQATTNDIEFILLNPGAFTHTSVSIRDALLAVNIPFIEVHLSNVFSREKFRHSSYFSDIAVGCVFGLGSYGYDLALQAASRLLSGEK